MINNYIDEFIEEKFISKKKKDPNKKEKRDVNKRRNLINIFTQHENKYSIDAFNFSEKQLRDCLVSCFDKKTIGTINIYKSNIKSYMDWADEHNLRNQNACKDYIVVIDEVSKELVNKSEENQALITKSDLYGLMNSNANNRSLTIALLLFEGLDGLEHLEIRNLKYENLDINKKSISINDRSILVPLQLLEFVIINKKTYHNQKNFKNAKLNTDFVIKKFVKGSKYNTEGTQTTGAALIATKLEALRGFLNNKKIEPGALKNSGMCYYLNIIEVIEKREVDLVDCQKVVRRFYKEYKSVTLVQELLKTYTIYKKQNLFNPNLIIDEEIINIYNQILAYDIEKIDSNDTDIINIENKEIIDSKEFFKSRGVREAEKENPPIPNTELGELGEKIIEEYLHFSRDRDNLNFDIKNETKEFIGYDIDVIDLSNGNYECIEIKTTETINSRFQFYMTNKELKIASKEKENYYLYVLYATHDASEEKIIPHELYIVQDPIKNLKLVDNYEIVKSLQESNNDSCILPLQYLININSKLIISNRDENFSEFKKKFNSETFSLIYS